MRSRRGVLCAFAFLSLRSVCGQLGRERLPVDLAASDHQIFRPDQHADRAVEHLRSGSRRSRWCCGTAIRPSAGPSRLTLPVRPSRARFEPLLPTVERGPARPTARIIRRAVVQPRTARRAARRVNTNLLGDSVMPRMIITRRCEAQAHEVVPRCTNRARYRLTVTRWEINSSR